MLHTHRLQGQADAEQLPDLCPLGAISELLRPALADR